MRWQEGRRSENVEDRRGRRVGTPAVIGGGLGGVILLLLVMLLGGDPQALLQQMAQQGPPGEAGPAAPGAAAPDGQPAAPDEEQEFVTHVLGTTEDVWRKLLAQHTNPYREPILVLFRGEVESACGFGNAASGPFYCPADEKVYIDLSFYHELKQRFGAPGDFAQAYVIAHEIGHHVQKILGTSDKVNALRRRISEEEFNQVSVRLELQADYYAGVWAHHVQRMNLLEPGDLDEALNAASAIGDDNIQRQAQGYVVPESFTHGTSQQRKKWFRKGFQSGRWEEGDTFTTNEL